MRITYDTEMDALTIVVSREPVEQTVDARGGRFVDLDADGNMVAIEILDASDGFDLVDLAREYDLRPVIVRKSDLRTRDAIVASVSERLSHAPEVTQVWLVAEEPLIIALVVSDLSLDRELELRASFAELTGEHDVELRIYSEAEGRADLARIGKRLRG